MLDLLRGNFRYKTSWNRGKRKVILEAESYESKGSSGKSITIACSCPDNKPVSEEEWEKIEGEVSSTLRAYLKVAGTAAL